MRFHRVSMAVLSCICLMACSSDFDINNVRDPGARPDRDPLEDMINAGDEDPGEEPQLDEDEPEAPIDEEPPPEDDCERTSDLIYVVDRDSQDLHLFNPVDLSFEYLTTLDCSMWGEPNSMGISRDGFAYVRYNTNDVYAVDLKSFECNETDYDAGFGSFGMGYAADLKSTWKDELFIANKNTLAKVDPVSWDVTTVASLSSQAELTGNAHGELWGFLPLEKPAALVELDKETGATKQEITISGFPATKDIDTFAFATWGGGYWLFVRQYGMGNSTTVYTVDKAGHLRTMVEDSGFNLVGAGVSTCAPTE